MVTHPGSPRLHTRAGRYRCTDEHEHVCTNHGRRDDGLDHHTTAASWETAIRIGGTNTRPPALAIHHIKPYHLLTDGTRINPGLSRPPHTHRGAERTGTAESRLERVGVVTAVRSQDGFYPETPGNLCNHPCVGFRVCGPEEKTTAMDVRRDMHLHFTFLFIFLNLVQQNPEPRTQGLFLRACASLHVITTRGILIDQIL